MTQQRITSPWELEELGRDIRSRSRSDKVSISVCSSTGCVALGSKTLMKTLREYISKEGLDEDVEVKETGCSDSVRRVLG